MDLSAEKKIRVQSWEWICLHVLAKATNSRCSGDSYWALGIHTDKILIPTQLCSMWEWLCQANKGGHPQLGWKQGEELGRILSLNLEYVQGRILSLNLEQVQSSLTCPEEALGLFFVWWFYCSFCGLSCAVNPGRGSTLLFAFDWIWVLAMLIYPCRNSAGFAGGSALRGAFGVSGIFPFIPQHLFCQ